MSRKVPTILIIEDDDGLFSKMAQTLIDEMTNQKTDFAIRRASTQRDAYLSWQEHTPHAISIDMQFPVLRGGRVDHMAGAQLFYEMMYLHNGEIDRELPHKAVMYSASSEADIRILLKRNGIREQFLPSILNKDQMYGHSAWAKKMMTIAIKHQPPRIRR
jgi:CheY-like chemotaxis protein